MIRASANDRDLCEEELEDKASDFLEIRRFVDTAFAGKGRQDRSRPAKRRGDGSKLERDLRVGRSLKGRPMIAFERQRRAHKFVSCTIIRRLVVKLSV